MRPHSCNIIALASASETPSNPHRCRCTEQPTKGISVSLISRGKKFKERLEIVAWSAFEQTLKEHSRKHDTVFLHTLAHPSLPNAPILIGIATARN